MNNYVIATSPYSALVRIYKRHGVDYGPVRLEKAFLVLWKYRREAIG